MVTTARRVLALLLCVSTLHLSEAFKGDALSGGRFDKTHESITNAGVKRAIYKFFLAREAQKAGATGAALDVSYYDGKAADSMTLYEIFRRFYPTDAAIAQKKFEDIVKVINQENIALATSQTLAYRSSYHFLSEDISGSNRRLITLRALIKGDIRSKNWQQSWEQIGRYLHTLQDFYSSTNWVELYGTSRGTNTNLGKQGASIGLVASPSDPTCTPCASSQGSCTNNLYGFITSNKVLTSGYHYAATDDAGNRIPKPATPASGTAGKCNYGGLTDFSRTDAPAGGINKDSNNPLLSPHHHLHDQAADLATQATEEFFDSLLKELEQDIYLDLFNQRYSKSLAIVIDDTGSMSEEIEASKQLAAQLIDDNAGGAVNFILVRFNDPDYELLANTNDPTMVKAKLRSLTPHNGGSDCWEYAFSGIIEAAKVAYPDSPLYVFTDAPVKDLWREEEMKALLISKNIKPQFIISKLWCSPPSKRSVGSSTPNVFQRLANELGGSYIATTNADVAQTVNLIRNQVRNAVAASIMEVTLPSTAAGLPSQQVRFDLDSSVEELTIILSSTGFANINEISSIKGPEYPLLVTDTFNNKEWRMSNPTTGEWKINATCSSDCKLTVKGRTEATFDYVIRNIAYVNGGITPSFVPLLSKPVSGSNVAIKVDLIGNYSHMQSFERVVLLSEGGRTLGGFTSDPSLTPFNMSYISLNVTVPRQKFRVGFIATTKRGGLIQRVSPDLITPSFLDLTSPSTLYEVRPGGTVDAQIFLGTPDDDTFFVTWNNPALIGVNSPARVDVRGGVGIIPIRFSADSSIANGTSSTIRFQVTSDRDPSINNFIMLRLVVKGPPVLPQDTTAPTCSVTASSIDGTFCRVITGCSRTQWIAGLDIRDNQPGVNIVDYTPKSSDVQVIQRTRTGSAITATVSGNCCRRSVQVIIQDTSGNQATCDVSTAFPNIVTPSTAAPSTAAPSTRRPTPSPVIPTRPASTGICSPGPGQIRNICPGGPGTYYTAVQATECATYTENGRIFACPKPLVFDVQKCVCNWQNRTPCCGDRNFDPNRYATVNPGP